MNSLKRNTEVLKFFTWKNFILIRRNPKNYFGILLSPIVVCLTLFCLQLTVDHVTDLTEVRNPKPVPITKVPKCLSPTGCLSIGYFVIGEKEDWIDEVMQKVAESNELEFGKDVKMVMRGSPADFDQHVQSHRNQTQIAVIFCTSSWQLSYKNFSLSLPCAFEQTVGQRMVFYSLYFNMTLGFQVPYLFKLNTPFPTNHIAISLKRSLDESLLRHFGNDDFELQISSVSFPATANKFLKGRDVSSLFGSFFCYMPIAVS